MRHHKSISVASFSPDGRKVVTASWGNTARLWDASTGKPLGPMYYEEDIWSASFSPDSRRVVTASMKGTARLWDASAGKPKPLGEAMLHNKGVRDARFSPDGWRVVTASNDETARLWDGLTGKPLGAPLRHAAPIKATSFSPDSQRVVTISHDTTRLWDVLTASAAEEGELADAAEVIGGFRVTALGNLEAIPPPERSRRLAALRLKGKRARDHEPTVDSFLRWYFTPRLKRTISPLSRMTVEEYIRTLLALGTEGARQEAEEAFPGHPLLAGSQP